MICAMESTAEAVPESSLTNANLFVRVGYFMRFPPRQQDPNLATEGAEVKRTAMLCRLSLLLAAQGAALSPRDLVQSIDAADASTCSDNSKFFDEQGLGCKNFGERRRV